LQVETGAGDETYPLKTGSYHGSFTSALGNSGIAALTVHPPFMSVFLRFPERVEWIRTEYVDGSAVYYAGELEVPRKDREMPARAPGYGTGGDPEVLAHGTFVCGTNPVDNEDLHAHADVDYFWLKGYSVANVVNAIEADINRLNVNIYRDEVCIQFRIAGISVHNNPFNEVLTSTNILTLINQFANHFQAAHDPFVSFDIAHLFTGKNLNGGDFGFGQLGDRYALTQQIAEGGYTANDYDRSIIEAHEIGHNYFASHLAAAHHCVWTTCWKTIMQQVLFDLPMLDDFSDLNTAIIRNTSPKANQ